MSHGESYAISLEHAVAARWRAAVLGSYRELVKRSPFDYAATQWRIHRKAWSRKAQRPQAVV
jgi:hypothetical protein